VIQKALDIDYKYGSPPPKNPASFIFSFSNSFSISIYIYIHSLVFQGTVCIIEHKIRSRFLLVDCQRRVMNVVIQFVSGNDANQTDVIKTCLPHLMNHMGPLKLPNPLPEEYANNQEEIDKYFPQFPSLGSEQAIIECLRGNTLIAEEMIPPEIFMKFGHLIEDHFSDPSTCEFMEFFELACCPKGPRVGSVIHRNQVRVMEVLLSSQCPNLREQVEFCFGIGIEGIVVCSQPERISSIIGTCLSNNNKHTSTMLQMNKMTIDTTFAVLKKLMVAAKRKIKKVKDNDELMASQHVVNDLQRGSYLTNMILVLSYQIDTLVHGRRLLRKVECWELIYYTIPSIFSAFLLECAKYEQVVSKVEIFEGMSQNKSQEEWKESLLDDLPMMRECMRVALRLIKAANHLG
jgi:hypothetical protein